MIAKPTGMPYASGGARTARGCSGFSGVRRVRRVLTIALLLIVCATSAKAHEIAACDLNGDGVGATSADYVTLLEHIGASRPDPRFDARADLDRDGGITVVDFSLLQRFCPLKGSED